MRELWENQFGNLFLWAPFLMAFGAGLYFNLGTEPNIILCVIGFFTSLIFILIKTFVPIRAVACFVFGFCWACVFTHCINTPQIPRDLHGVNLTGIVENIDYTADKTRIYLKTNLSHITDSAHDAIVRVSVNSNIRVPNIGDEINIHGGLYQPAGADAPESFDYARWAYFNGLTATGYANSIKIVHSNRISDITTLRDNIHRGAKSFLVDTLVLGYKNAVPDDDAPIWTATGVGHVWSISGFHITLVSGWLFAIFYLIFRSIGPLVRRVPARIPALICAWVGLLFYLFLSGSDVATIRAFIMTSLVFLAFICGRSAISVRNVCLAFCMIFFMNPHFVMQPGFQLSFAAIFGLVWLWYDARPKLPHNKILKVIYTAVLTSIVATVFTAPFVVMHFYDLPIYGLIGNLVLLPVFSIAIMPLIMIGVFTNIFGWAFPIDFAHDIYSFCLNVGRWIANLPAATITLPHIPNVAMVFIILGFISVMFIRPVRIKINYILGGLFIGIDVAIIVTYPRPMFYATYDHELVAFVNADNKLEFSKSRASNHYFTFDTWKQLNGENTGTKNIRRKPVDGIWIYETENFTVAYIQKYMPLQNNIVHLCNDENIDYIVSYFNVNAPKCNHKILRGGFVIYPNGHVNYVSRLRPWHNPRE